MSDYKAKHLADNKTRSNRRSIENTAKNTAGKDGPGDLYSLVQCVLESIIAAFLLRVFCVNISVV